MAGHRCQSGDHDYSQLDDCNFKGTSGAPTPDTMQWVTTYTVTDGGSCGASTGGGVTTPPVGGGVGSGGGYNTAASPCAKLQAMLNKNISVNTPPGPINEMPPYLDGHMNSANTGTKELTINVYTAPNSNHLDVALVESNPSDQNLEVSVSPCDNCKSTFFGHDHPNGNGVLSIFSLTDIYGMLTMFNHNSVDENTYFYLTTTLGTKYYLRFTNLDFKNMMNGINYFQGWDFPDPAVRGAMKESREKDYEKYVKYNKTPGENLKEFLHFFSDNDIMGVEVLSVEADKIYIINYNPDNNTITKKPCS